MGTVSSEKVEVEESLALLRRARALLRSSNYASDFHESIGFSLGAMTSLARQLALTNDRHPSMMPGREHAPKDWAVLDSFLVEKLLPEFPERLSKARQLLDLAAIHSRMPYAMTREVASEDDAVIVMESATGVIHIVEELTARNKSTGEVDG